MIGAPALAVEGIEFAYGHQQILFGIDLAVQPGEAVALLGTNGAGKSTLLRVVTGLERPSSGRVVLHGTDITAVPAEQRAALGLVLINGGRATFTDMTVAENLDMQRYSRRRGGPGERQERVLAIFPRLAERLRQPAGTLSGGEQQQLALAKALILEPSVLCIDELSLGLAPVVVQELLSLVRSINDSGVAVVLVEQSLNLAAEMCGRAVFLEKGAVRFEGATRKLLDSDEIARAVFLGRR